MEAVASWLGADDLWFARAILQRGIAATYAIAFVVTWNQFPALLGEHGLLPVPRYLQATPFRARPTLFHRGYSDTRLRAAAAVGFTLAAAIAVTDLPVVAPAWLLLAAWLVMWALYLSIVNVGQVFYGFGWESLLLEAGAIAAFLGPHRMTPPLVTLWLARWLVVRVEFGAGLIKLRGDPCWRDLTCLEYHHETQPLPGPASWWFHHLPRSLHRVETGANHLVQLVLPFGLFLPHPVSSLVALAVIVSQAWLIISGNFAWLNWLTVVLAFAAVNDRAVAWITPVSTPAAPDPQPVWLAAVTVAFAAVVAVLSVRVVRNMLSRYQAMNASFDPLRLVNTYGAFGSVTRRRDELVIEGTVDPDPGPDSAWQEYGFRAKPGDPRRRPPQVAPYHLRLDWLMWFVPLGGLYQHPWLPRLLLKLLDGDRAIRRLLRIDPFPDTPPTHVRVLRYRYRYTTWSERRSTGAWWHRQLIGVEIGPVRRDAGGVLGRA